MPKRLGEWTVALAVALAVHGVVLAAMVGWARDAVERERSAGQESVVWGVPMSVAAQEVEGDEAVEETVAEEIAEPIEETPTTEPAEAETREPEPAENRQAPDEPIADDAEAVATRGETTDRPVAEAVPEADASPETASSSSDAAEQVRTARTVDPAQAEVVEPSQDQPLAKPRRKPQDLAEAAAAKRRAEEARQAKSRERSASANATAGVAKGSGGRRQADGGRADASNYAGRVLAHLQRYKRYPSAAARRRLAGVVTVRFAINGSGGLSAVSINGSSGESLLDEAALAMVRNASPFPPIPADLGRSSMTFTVPVRYRPR